MMFRRVQSTQRRRRRRRPDCTVETAGRPSACRPWWRPAGRSSTLTRRRPRLEFTLAHQPRCRHRHHNNILQMWSGAELEERAAKNRCCGSSAQLCRIPCWPEVRGSGIGRVWGRGEAEEGWAVDDDDATRRWKTSARCRLQLSSSDYIDAPPHSTTHRRPAAPRASTHPPLAYPRTGHPPKNPA